MVKDPKRVNFSYRDNLWQGSDLLATGIASFGQISGVHYQNQAEWEQYCGTLEAGDLPLMRGLHMTPDERLIREMILQLKRGYLDAGNFQKKFGVDILDRWAEIWSELRAGRYMHNRSRIRPHEANARRAAASRCTLGGILRATISRRAVHVSYRLPRH